MVIESPEFVEKPLVSVGIITYNQMSYIGICIESIIKQVTDFAFEIVISEDCSTDGTFDICKRYQEKYPHLIKLIHNETNLGLSSNYIHLLSQLRGDFVATIGGDDYWIDAYKLQKQLTIFLVNDNISAVFTNAKIVDKSGFALKSCMCNYVTGEYSLHDFFREELMFPPLTLMYRASAASSTNSMYEKLRNPFLEDWTFWICLGTQGNFYYISDATAAYRINPNSITHTQNAVDRWKEDFKIRRNLIQLLPPEYHKYLKNNYKTYFKLGVAYKKAGDMPRAIMYLLKSFFAHPVKFIKLLTDR